MIELHHLCALCLLYQHCIVSEAHFVLDYRLVVRNTLFLIEHVKAIDEQLVIAFEKIPSPEPKFSIL